jgi:transposase
MALADKYTIRDLKADFPDDGKCLEFLFDSLHTRECSCGGTYSRISTRQQFQCSKCRFQIAPMAGTIFEKSTTPLTLWFHALFVFSNAKSGISAKELERQIGVTYKTAWRMLKLIREQLTQSDDLLGGSVEVDEAYFGGRGHGGEYNKNQREVMSRKTNVIGAVERGGIMRAKVVPDIKAPTIGQFLKDNVSEGSKLYTDSANRYALVSKAYDRASVSHRQEEYVRGEVHVNNIEQFWGHLKRSIKGTHKVISKKHFQAYLDGFVFHYNQRNDRARFSALIACVVG